MIKCMLLAFKYPDRIRLSHVPYPLSYHVHAMPAARAADCADMVDAFAPFVDVVFRKQDSLGVKSWTSYAAEAGVADTLRTAHCAEATESVDKLEWGEAFGRRIGVEGTPTVIINGWRLPSPPNEATLDAIVCALEAGENPFSRRNWSGLSSAVLFR